MEINIIYDACNNFLYSIDYNGSYPLSYNTSTGWDISISKWGYMYLSHRLVYSNSAYVIINEENCSITDSGSTLHINGYAGLYIGTVTMTLWLASTWIKRS